MLMKHRNKEAVDFFMSYIKRNPGDQSAYAFLYSAADSETTPSITRFFESLPPQAAEEHRLLLSYLYLRTSDVRSARQVNDEFISKYKGKPPGTRAKPNNCYIALYHENDPQGAASILKEIVQKENQSAPIELLCAESDLAAYIDPKTGKMPYSEYRLERSGSSETFQAQLPEEGGMIQNYPNPFNPTTTISYRLPKSGEVELKVYDVLGREVIKLVRGYQEAGVHSASFNGQNLASGVYFYRLTAPGITQVKKMLSTK